MCSVFGLIDHQNRFSTHDKNRILNTLARECEIRGTDATGIAYHFGGRLRIFKRPVPAHRLRLRVPPGVSGGDISGFALAVDEETDTLLQYDVVNLDSRVDEALLKNIEKDGKVLYEKV